MKRFRHAITPSDSKLHRTSALPGTHEANNQKPGGSTQPSHSGKRKVAQQIPTDPDAQVFELEKLLSHVIEDPATGSNSVQHSALGAEAPQVNAVPGGAGERLARAAASELEGTQSFLGGSGGSPRAKRWALVSFEALVSFASVYPVETRKNMAKPRRAARKHIIENGAGGRRGCWRCLLSSSDSWSRA
ncbi:hypothetical protein CALCODRAFT_491182 [Calocera cornea HHB12733]|uniref:Uncharacterized protein n=1 Tax=Calocera cornea HHB12733 TaxID=1353952 RepID=A0A165J4Z7_9BASI|nr:hypothetical protein CALCODRAFT_491182 [Calocera cornea HHB12733]